MIISFENSLNSEEFHNVWRIYTLEWTNVCSVSIMALKPPNESKKYRYSSTAELNHYDDIMKILKTLKIRNYNSIYYINYMWFEYNSIFAPFAYLISTIESITLHRLQCSKCYQTNYDEQKRLTYRNLDGIITVNESIPNKLS